MSYNLPFLYFFIIFFTPQENALVSCYLNIVQDLPPVTCKYYFRAMIFAFVLPLNAKISLNMIPQTLLSFFQSQDQVLAYTQY